MYFPEFHLSQYMKASLTEIYPCSNAYWRKPCLYSKYSRLPTCNCRWHDIWSTDASCHKWMVWDKELLSPITCGLLDLQRKGQCREWLTVQGSLSLRKCAKEPFRPLVKDSLWCWQNATESLRVSFLAKNFSPKLPCVPNLWQLLEKCWCHMKFPKDLQRSWPLTSSNFCLTAFLLLRITTVDS